MVLSEIFLIKLPGINIGKFLFKVLCDFTPKMSNWYDDGSALDEEFESAAVRVKNLSKRPTDSDLLLLYGLYKQATEGSARVSQKPAIYDLKVTAKWNAWYANTGMTKTTAKTKYVELVKDFQKKY